MKGKGAVVKGFGLTVGPFSCRVLAGGSAMLDELTYLKQAITKLEVIEAFFLRMNIKANDEGMMFEHRSEDTGADEESEEEDDPCEEELDVDSDDDPEEDAPDYLLCFSHGISNNLFTIGWAVVASQSFDADTEEFVNGLSASAILNKINPGAKPTKLVVLTHNSDETWTFQTKRWKRLRKLGWSSALGELVDRDDLNDEQAQAIMKAMGLTYLNAFSLN